MQVKKNIKGKFRIFRKFTQIECIAKDDRGDFAWTSPQYMYFRYFVFLAPIG